METVTINGEDESPIVVNETNGSESEVEVSRDACNSGKFLLARVNIFKAPSDLTLGATDQNSETISPLSFKSQGK